MNLTELQTYYPKILAHIVEDKNTPQIKPNFIFILKDNMIGEYINLVTDKEYFTFLINNDDTLVFIERGTL